MYDGWGNYGNNKNHPNQEGIDYRRLFGDEIRARKDKINKILKDEGINNIEYHVYDTGHYWTEEVLDDMVMFLKEIQY